MNPQERRRCMRLLQEAKQNNARACDQLTRAVAENFSYMIRGYNTTDPAFDRDDLMAQFRMGIWQAIPRVDHRGDPLFHLAWRGQQAVRSMLQVIKRRRCGGEDWLRDFGQERSIGTLPTGWDLPDPSFEHDPPHALQLQEARDEAHRHVITLLKRVQLTKRQRDVIAWMLTDPDIGSEGANLRLARRLGVSAQLASKYRKDVAKLLAGTDGQPDEKPFECVRCGRGFGSRGALTQHLNGQSGHVPCLVA